MPIIVAAVKDDPLKAIATAIASYYAPWAIPLIEGADVAQNGGDIGDILEASAKAYVGQQIGSYAGSYASGAASTCLLYTSPSPRDGLLSRMPSSA